MNAIDPLYADVQEDGQLTLGIVGEQRSIPGMAAAGHPVEPREELALAPLPGDGYADGGTPYTDDELAGPYSEWPTVEVKAGGQTFRAKQPTPSRRRRTPPTAGSYEAADRWLPSAGAAISYAIGRVHAGAYHAVTVRNVLGEPVARVQVAADDEIGKTIEVIRLRQEG